MKDSQRQNKDTCCCGNSIQHKRIRLCAECFIIKRKKDWKLNEQKRIERDSDRREALLKRQRDNYYNKYRDKRLAKEKICECGKVALKNSKYCLCKECADKHRSLEKKEYQIDRKKNHLPTKIRENIKSRLKKALKQDKSNSVVEYLGCSIDNYIIYLESKFLEGMSWDNYGSKWHIDHIKPLSTDYSDMSLHNYTNTQPLWKEDHVRKTARENGQKMY